MIAPDPTPLSPGAQIVYDGVSRYLSDKAAAWRPALKFLGGAFLFALLFHWLGGWVVVAGLILYGLARHTWPAAFVLVAGGIIFLSVPLGPQGAELVVLGTIFATAITSAGYLGFKQYRRVEKP